MKHIFHTWGKWEVYAEMDIFTIPFDRPELKSKTGVLIRQRRKCETCGLEKYRQQILSV